LGILRQVAETGVNLDQSADDYPGRTVPIYREIRPPALIQIKARDRWPP
jgi:hypothetical protein